MYVRAAASASSEIRVESVRRYVISPTVPLPLISTPSYSCCARRRRQHGYRPLPDDVEPLPQGYARHHVVIAAGLVALARSTLAAPAAGAGSGGADNDSELGGQVWTVDLVSGLTSLSRTVATYRCRTCSGRYAARRDGVPALAALLPERVI